MKKIKFTTNKGKFAIIDIVDNTNVHTGIKLSEITEEQARYIVGDSKELDHSRRFWFTEPIKELHSLLKSKGVHLFKNPYVSKINPLEYKESEEKTFYNPYIFKI